MKFLRIIILIFFLVTPGFVFCKVSIVEIEKELYDSGKVDKAKFVYNASIHYGALLGYKEHHAPLIFTNPFAAELTVTKFSSGKKDWEQLYNFPSVAYSLAYYNYGLPHDYGEALSGTASYDFNLMRKEKKRLWLSAGIGLVYSSRKFNEQINPDNKAISTDFSYVLQGSLKYDLMLNEQWAITPTFSFRHFSNATLGIPNNGMNFPLLGIGLSYLPQKYAVPERKDSVCKIDKTIHFTISTGLAIKKVLRIDERHKIHTISIYADRQITKFNSIMIGMDAFYNNSLASEYLKYGQWMDEAEIDHRQLAITFGQELFIGKIGILTQGGIFVYQPHKFWGSFYQKYGVKYYLTKDVFLGSIVKVYIGTADYMEWTAGVKF